MHMKIAVLGTGKKAEAWKAKNLNANSYAWVQDTKSNHEFDIFIDFNYYKKLKKQCLSIYDIYIKPNCDSNIYSLNHFLLHKYYSVVLFLLLFVVDVLVQQLLC